MRSIRYTLLFYLLIFLFSCKSEKGNVLTIAVAANMRYAMDDIVEDFSTKTGVGCRLIVASSGKLTAQIKEGAPYDVFLSADMKYPMEIHQNHLAGFPPKVYAKGALVLWTTVDGMEPSLYSLKGNSVKHVAIANPKTAPYGRAAEQALKHYGLYELIKDKLIFGESISQVNQFVASGTAEVGFTVPSVVLAPGMKGKGRWVLIDSQAHDPVEQGMVVLKGKSSVGREAIQFYEYLFSTDAKKILLRHGYTLNE
ncbi:MAG: molybdate ABC transporter substrate-binding protein [Flavobacteriaceae bacterium]